jgi:DeoR/GlpR family transcriptional regulator of sugar metabolism
MRVEYSFQLLEFDFINSLSTIFDTKKFYIFHVINYLSRFSITFFFKTTNAFDVISILQKMFILYIILKIVYCDREQHFNNVDVTQFLKRFEISYFFNSFDSSQSTDMIEIENRLLENILKKFESQN